MALCVLCPAQSKPAGAGKSPFCTRDNALDMIKAQIDVAKTLSETYRRIPVLIRAADLLWPHQQDRARTIFTEAFELATEHEKEVDEKGPRTLVLRMPYPDLRFVVIRAIAKRDGRWAKEITQRMLTLADASPSRDSFSDLLMAERLLDSASKLISTDTNGAVDLARASFRYPASAGLTRFLYALAQVNQRAADEFYYLALGNYATKPLREFLYLQAYPFLLPTSLNTPFFAYYQVPLNYVTTDISLYLRRGFVNVIVHRAQRALEEPEEVDAYRDPSGVLTPPKVQLLRSLMELEPHIKGPLLELLPAVTQARERILVSLSPEMQKLLLQPGREISTAPVRTFDEEIELALKNPDVNVRDDLLATAILSDRSNSQSLEKLVALVDKISYSNVRAPLVDTLYFRRLPAFLNIRKFDDAEKIASKVEGHEQRAYLRIEIAKVLLNESAMQIYASEVLDQAIADAKKAGPTIFAARTLLTASNLYAKIDLGRAISVLTDAINLVNRLESPDFVRDDQALVRRIQRPGIGRGHYVFRDYMPGLDPERALGEMAKLDFDTALSQASALTDKLQRALSMLALAEVCLQQRR